MLSFLPWHPPLNDFHLTVNYDVEIILQGNLSEVSLSDLLQLAKQLKYPSITALRLSVSPEEQLSGNSQINSSFLVPPVSVMRPINRVPF